MTRWVNKFNRVIPYIGESVQILRICEVRHNGIRADKATQLRVIPARVVGAQPLTAEKVLLVVLTPFDKLRAGCKALGGCVAKGTASVANDDVGDTKKPRLMGLSSGAV